MALTISGYKKYIEQRGFVQNPSFYAMAIYPGQTITGSSSPVILYPDSILIPGRNFINTPFAYYGPEFSMPLRREYNELSVNFIVYQDWVERRIIEDWMDSVLPYHLKDPSLQASDIYPDNLTKRLRTIEIGFYTRENNKKPSADSFEGTLNCSFFFYDAYPLMITPTSFESENSGYTIFTVNFSYRLYEFSNAKSDRDYINKSL